METGQREFAGGLEQALRSREARRPDRGGQSEDSQKTRDAADRAACGKRPRCGGTGGWPRHGEGGLLALVPCAATCEPLAHVAMK